MRHAHQDLRFFRGELLLLQESVTAGEHIESTRLLIWPGLITWALGCTFGTQLCV